MGGRCTAHGARGQHRLIVEILIPCAAQQMRLHHLPASIEFDLHQSLPFFMQLPGHGRIPGMNG